MNYKKIILLGSILFANIAHANIVINLPASANGDGCGNIAGVWTGSGTVKAGIIECKYHGTASVTSVNTNSFNMLVNLQKDSGICPDNEQLQMPGSCTGGVLKLDTDKAHLHGSINDASTVVDLSGKVTFDVFGSPVTADINNMHMQKK
jgi:hypothetical protein